MAKSAAELQAEWWERWWERDFSWTGLAAKPVGQNDNVVHGGVHGEQDLQTWWRRDPETGVIRNDQALRAAGELVRGPDGLDWHIAHVPLQWPGKIVGKAGWDEEARHRLAMVIAHRLAVASETTVDEWG